MPDQSKTLRDRLQSDMKAAMKAREKTRLGVIRMILAAVKQREVDERITLDDTQIIVVLDKMLKQRRDSEQQYREAGRDDLADTEASEIRIVQGYLPQPLTDGEISAYIKGAISESGASGVNDMGKIMGILKPKMQGRADMGIVSKQVKSELGNL